MEKEFDLWKTKFGYMFMEAKKYTKPSINNKVYGAAEHIHSFKANSLFDAHQKMNSFLGQEPFILPSESHKEFYCKEFEDD